MRTLSLILCLFVFSFSASKSISSFSVQSGKYLVVSEPVIVSSGDTLFVPPGSAVLFSNLSGISVSAGGFLSAVGTKGQPIYFTSLLDTSDSASAFDWNGIELKKGSSANLSYCFIAFSTSGVTAEDSIGVVLDSCIFSSNGQWNFSVSGVITQVPDLQPFSYASSQSEFKTSAAIISVPSLPVQEKVSLDTASANQHSPAFRTRNIVLGGVGLALAAAGFASLYKANQYRSAYDSYVPGNTGFDKASPSSRQDHFDFLRRKHGFFSAAAWSCLGLASADVLFLAVTVRF